MTDSAASSPSRLLKVQGTSRLAFGATTVALVTLASGGTALLVASSTHGVGSPTSLPSGTLPPDPLPASPGLVVDRPAGAQPEAPEAPPASDHDETAQAILHALARRPVAGRRTLTAPLVVTPAPAPAPPAVAPTPPAPGRPGPVVTPRTPATGGGSGGSEGSDDGDEPDASHGNHRSHPAHPVHPTHPAHPQQGRGKHAKPKPSGKGKHAR